jgi:hypothetical protein
VPKSRQSQKSGRRSHTCRSAGLMQSRIPSVDSRHRFAGQPDRRALADHFIYADFPSRFHNGKLLSSEHASDADGVYARQGTFQLESHQNYISDYDLTGSKT